MVGVTICQCLSFAVNPTLYIKLIKTLILLSCKNGAVIKIVKIVPSLPLKISNLFKTIAK